MSGEPPMKPILIVLRCIFSLQLRATQTIALKMLLSALVAGVWPAMLTILYFGVILLLGNWLVRQADEAIAEGR